MAVIDIGPDAIDRGDAYDGYYTTIFLDNSANDSGKITKSEIWVNQNIAGCKVGPFYGTPPNFTCRDFATIGNVTAGSKQTFTGLDITVEADDYFGMYFTTGKDEASLSGFAGVYWKSGYHFENGSQAYSLSAGGAESFYGEGETIAPPVRRIFITHT